MGVPSTQQMFEQLFAETGGDRYGTGVVGAPNHMRPQHAGVSSMNPIALAAAGSRGPMNWHGAGQFAQQANYSQMNPATAMFLSGQQNFAPQIGGAMGQIGDLLQGNAARVGAIRDQNLQAQLLRESRNDANQKFTMIFNELLGGKQRQEYRDLNGNIQYREVSPLLSLLERFLPGGQSSSMSSVNTRVM